MARSVVDLTHHPELTDELRRALDEDALALMFQPEVELASGAVVGMEALLRWPHPARGLLGPADFLSTAERAGLMPACEICSRVCPTSIGAISTRSAMPLPVATTKRPMRA